MCACMKNKFIFFIYLFTDARVRNKNTDLIIIIIIIFSLFNYIKSRKICECLNLVYLFIQ